MDFYVSDDGEWIPADMVDGYPHADACDPSLPELFVPAAPTGIPVPAAPLDGGAGYVSLHVHSDLSPLDGTASPEKLANRAADLGMPALAITDHGTMGGCYRFAHACRTAGVKPILGIEAYAAIRSRFDPQMMLVKSDEAADADEEKGEAGYKKKWYDHIVLLASTPRGWLNLVAITNASQDTYRYKPLVDLELVEAHNDGIIVLTGCVGGMVAGPLARGDERAARTNLEAIAAAAQPGHVFVEVMDHGLGIERAAIDGLYQLAADMGLPLVATNDVHYLTADDARAHEVELAIQCKKPLQTPAPPRFAFNGTGYFLKSGTEMLAQRPQDPVWAQAVANTALVAGMVDDWVLPDPAPHFPHPPALTNGAVWWASSHRLHHPPMPPQDIMDAPVSLNPVTAPLGGDLRDLVHLATHGVAWRYGDADGRVAPDVMRRVCERLVTELTVIRQMGFVDYFLLVADLVAHARSIGSLVGSGRGSAGGSITAYLTGITDVDPLEGDLLFERFLELGREGWPDIDIDFERESVPKLYAYLEETYGQGTVARCGTLAKEKSRRVLLDTFRAFGFDPSVGASLTTTIPVDSGKPYPLEVMCDPLSDSGDAFRRLVESTPGAAEAVEVALRLEGVSAGVGIHACGVILSDEPLDALIPLRRDRESGMWVTEWEYPDLERTGYLKLDMLRLRTQSELHATADALSPDQAVLVNRMPEVGSRDWTATMDLFATGRLTGVFQMGSSGMKQVAMGVAPATVAEVADVIALYRPGALGTGQHERYIARRRGLEPVSYDQFTSDPAEQGLLATVLGATQGIILYQEQLMQLGRLVAGFDAAERSLLRHAVGKKKADEMGEVGQMFLDRAPMVFDTEGLSGVRPDGVVPSFASPPPVSPAFSRETAQRLWTVMQDSAKYSFNKSHSWAYAVLAIITAAAKARWPAAYAAAKLSLTKDADKRVALLESLHADGVEVLAPDVNLSGSSTLPAGEGVIRLGLSEVVGVGAAGDVILAEREANGPFTSLADAMARIPKQDVTVGAWRALVCAGAFDAFGTRLGQAMSLLARGADPTDAEWSSVERCAMQRSVLRTCVDRSPLGVHVDEMSAWTTPYGSHPVPVPVLLAQDPGEAGASCVVAGILGSGKLIEYSKGTRFAFTLEGGASHVDGVMWDADVRRFEQTGRFPRPGDAVAVEGTVRTRSFEREQADEDDPDGEPVVVTVTQTQVTARRMWPITFSDDSVDPSSVPMPWDEQGPDIPATVRPPVHESGPMATLRDDIPTLIMAPAPDMTRAGPESPVQTFSSTSGTSVPPSPEGPYAGAVGTVESTTVASDPGPPVPARPGADIPSVPAWAGPTPSQARFPEVRRAKFAAKGW